MTPEWIQEHAPPDAFPCLDEALHEPNGLLAVGGDLSPNRLLCAYRRGIFPWFSEGDPVLWWSPDPRTVLFPDKLKISRSLRKTLRRGTFRVTMDQAFAAVIQGCAAPRKDGHGTWITTNMHDAYVHLHELGHAHSVECWDRDTLVGGLYGVSLGRVFFGESMFSRATDASKVALVYLCERGYRMIDCQLANPHLQRLGAIDVRRAAFARFLEIWCEEQVPSAAALASA